MNDPSPSLSASACARDHPLLQSLHAAVQLHRDSIRDSQRPTLPQTRPAGSEKPAVAATEQQQLSPTTSAAAAAPGACLCTRCTLFQRAAKSSSSAFPSLHAHLYETALSLQSPFVALSPNLSQLAFCMQTDSDESATVAPATAAAVATTHSVSLRLEDFLDADGFLRFDAFDSIAASAATSSSNGGGADGDAAASSSTFDSGTSCVFSASSAALLSVCHLLHAHVRSISASDFQRRYGRVTALSNHADMITPLFDLFHRGCDETQGSDGEQGDGGSGGAVLMLLSSHIERLLGDIFCARRSNPHAICPRMLRDLLVCDEVAGFLPPGCLWLLTALIGSPRSFNLRNILWHGFLPLHCLTTSRSLEPFVSALWLLHLSVLNRCEPLWAASSPSNVAVAATVDCAMDSSSAIESAIAAATDLPIQPVTAAAGSSTTLAASSSSSQAHPCFRRPLKHKFPGDAALHAHLSSALFLPSSASGVTDGSSTSTTSDADDAPRSSAHWPVPPAAVWGATDPTQWTSLTASVEQLMAHSYLLSHTRLHDFMFAWRVLPSNPFLALTVLLPLIEQTCRHMFVYANARLDGYSDNQNPEQSATRPNGAGPTSALDPLNPHIEPGLLLAQSERLFTTLDLVLSPTIDPLPDATSAAAAASPSPEAMSQVQKCGRASAFAFPLVSTPCAHPAAPAVGAQINTLYRHHHPLLPATPGCALLLAVHELLISRLGPRLRDRVAHGEICWADPATLPRWLPLYTVNLLLALACKFPICAPVESDGRGNGNVVAPPSSQRLSVPDSFSTPLAQSAAAFLSTYVPFSHARSLTMQRMLEATKGLTAMQKLMDERETRLDAPSEDVSSPPLPPSDEDLPLRAPVRLWVAFAHRQPPLHVAAKLRLLVSECSHRSFAGLDAMAVWSSRLTLQATTLLLRMRARDPLLPLWQLVPDWILTNGIREQSAANSSAGSIGTMEWWTLASDSFWTRSHAAFHHPSPSSPSTSSCAVGHLGASSSSCSAAAPPSPHCSLSCVLHCHERCMNHAPVLSIERALQLHSVAHATILSSYAVGQQAAAAPSASSSKLRQAEYTAESLPAVQICSSATLIALALLWEQMLAKAHPVPLVQSDAAAGTAREAVIAASSSSPSPPTRPSLLQQDRSIAGLLKKSTASLDRMRTLYVANQWLSAMGEWATILQAVEVWLNAHPSAADSAGLPP